MLITSKQSGFTFVEMLVAMVINVVLFAALLSVFTSNLKSYNNAIAANTLNQQLEVALNTMAKDIRRAGFWGNASSMIGTGANTNPFMTAPYDITVPSSTCILFTYDENKSGTLAVAGTSDDDRYGFRLMNGILQSRPPAANNFSCTAAASTWENLTDPNVITITALSFTLSTVSTPMGQASNTMQLRSVDISITGQLASNATVTKTLTMHVRVRNDEYTP